LKYRRIDELKAHPKNEEIYAHGSLVDLVESIKSQGFFDENPVVINEEDVILSGHRRWLACQELKIETIPTVFKIFENEIDELEFLLNSNRQRIKSVAEKTREGITYEGLEKKRAKERQGERTDLDSNIEQNSAQSERGPQARDFVSSKIGMNHFTYDQSKKVINRLNGLHESGRNLSDNDIDFGGYLYSIEYGPDEKEFYEFILSSSVNGALRAIRGHLFEEINDDVWNDFMDENITLKVMEERASIDYKKKVEKRKKSEEKEEKREDVIDGYDERTGRDHEERADNFQETNVEREFAIDESNGIPVEVGAIPSDEEVDEHIEKNSVNSSIGGQGHTPEYYLGLFRDMGKTIKILRNQMDIAFRGYGMAPLEERLLLIDEFTRMVDYADNYFLGDKDIPEDEDLYEDGE